MPEESIYNLTPKVCLPPEIPVRYTSKFAGQAKDEFWKTKGSKKKTMGQAEVITRDPKDFLKRRQETEGEKAKSDKPARRCPQEPKDPIPKEKPMMNLTTQKNFINLNAVDNIMAVPRQPERLFVDDKSGKTNNLRCSGLEPVFILKKDYGVTPMYLKNRNKNLGKIEAEVDRYVKEKKKSEAMEEIGPEERDALLQGLKMNWEEVQMEYQKLPIFIDTEPKRNRKQHMEREMKKLEGFISLIEHYQKIFLVD